MYTLGDLEYVVKEKTSNRKQKRLKNGRKKYTEFRCNTL